MVFKMKKIHYISIFCLLTYGLSFAQDLDSLKIDLKLFKNLYQINDSIFRSEQPSKKGFKALEEVGVKTILNFRRLRNDNAKARDTDLELIHIPLQTKKIEEVDIIMALKAINDAQKPVLIHCWHGSDRTGVVIAAYRIIFENWSKEDAITEFRKKEFGYHENWYPHLIGILENLASEAIKQELRLD